MRGTLSNFVCYVGQNFLSPKGFIVVQSYAAGNTFCLIKYILLNYYGYIFFIISLMDALAFTQLSIAFFEQDTHSLKSEMIGNSWSL